MHDESLRAMRPVADALDRLGIRYHVGGSLASSAYGIPRSTIDVDLVADVTPEQAEPLAAALGDDYYAAAEGMRDAVRHGTSFNVIYLLLMYKVDVFPLKDRDYDRQAFERAQVHAVVEGDPTSHFPLASPEDVILNKLEWYRLGEEVSNRQWLDVLNVVKVRSTTLDCRYLRRWAGELRVSDLLERALRESDL